MVCRFHYTASVLLFPSLYTCLFVFLSPVSPLASYVVFPADSLPCIPFSFMPLLNPVAEGHYTKAALWDDWPEQEQQKGSNYSSMRDSSALCWPLDALALGSHCPPSAIGTHWTGLKSCLTLPENKGVQGYVYFTVDFYRFNIISTNHAPSSHYLLPLFYSSSSTFCLHGWVTRSVRAFIKSPPPKSHLTLTVLTMHTFYCCKSHCNTCSTPHSLTLL